MDSKCSICSVLGSVCLGMSFPRICELIRSGRLDYRDQVLRIAGEPVPVSPVITPIPKDHRPRVGFLTPILGQGGTEEWHRQLLLGFDPEKINVTGLVVRNPEDFHPQTWDLFQGRIPTGYGIENIQNLMNTSDIIVTWGNMYLGGTEIPDRVKIVFVSHGDKTSQFTVDNIHRMEPIVTDWVRCSPQAYMIPGVFSELLENGIDFQRINEGCCREDVRKEWGVESGDRVILYMGRFCDYDKRVSLLPEIMKRLPKRYKLIMVGSGVEEPTLKSRCEQEIPGRFRFFPWTFRIGELIRGADRGILLSSNESFALVLAEYLYSGLPVLSTPVGFAAMNPAFFKILSKNPSVKECAIAIENDFDDPDSDARPRSRQGLRYVQEYYSSEIFIKRWTEYLIGLVPYRRSERQVHETVEDHVRRLFGERLPTEQDAILAAISVCPSRGSVLPISIQQECGCGELTECRVGKGIRPGQVLFSECLTCKTEQVLPGSPG